MSTGGGSVMAFTPKASLASLAPLFQAQPIGMAHHPPEEYSVDAAGQGAGLS
jgi:hypothetical protein